MTSKDFYISDIFMLRQRPLLLAKFNIYWGAPTKDYYCSLIITKLSDR